MMDIKELLVKAFDTATEASVAVGLSIGFAMFTWHCIVTVWRMGGPFAPPATLVMACLGVLLILNAGNLAAALLVAINDNHKSPKRR